MNCVFLAVLILKGFQQLYGFLNYFIKIKMQNCTYICIINNYYYSAFSSRGEKRLKKLLYVYIILFSIFSFYIYFFHLRDDPSTPFTQNGNRLQSEAADKYVMVTFQAGIDYWKSAIKGFEDAANELNVSVEYRGATQYDVHEQITVLEQVIAKKPSGIALTAINPEMLNMTINKAIEAGIPVVLFDSDAPESDAYTFLGTDNYHAGVTSAHKMAELIDGKGNVAVISLPEQLNHKERTNGFVETLEKEYPNINVVGIKDGKGSQVESERVTTEIISDFPNIKGVFATEANGGVGVAEAVQSLDSKEKIKIISFDTDKQTLDKIKEGHISATLAQGTWNMGYWSLQFLFQHNHEKQSLPEVVNTGVSIVTKENLEDYYAD